MIKEWIQNFDFAAYKKNLNQDEKLPSMKRKIDRNYKTDCWEKLIMESLNWLSFLDIMDSTSEKINNDTNLLPSLLKILQFLRLNFGGIKKKNII